VYCVRIGIISSGTSNDRVPPVYGGGIQKYIWNLAKSLNDFGHEVHIFANQQSAQLRSEVVNGVHIHRIARVIRTQIFSTFIFGLKTYIRILKVQKQWGRFHILNAQSRVSGLIIRSFLPRIPFVFTAHNWDVVLTYPKTLIPVIPYCFLFWVEKRICLKSDSIIALTDYFRRIMANRYKVPISKINIAPNMVALQERRKDRPELYPFLKKITAEPYFIFIGRLEKEKGLGYLVEAFKDLLEQKKQLYLLIIGGGSLRNQLRQQLQELKLQNNIYILGNIHETQLEYIMERAKALILPSEFEIMPTVILEAWAAGCPVIVNNFYGVQALIRHNSTGLLFQKEKPGQLLSFVHEVLENETLRNKLLETAKAEVKANFAAPQVGKKILKIYYNLLNRCN
jgi:glycogen(starch) synthase